MNVLSNSFSFILLVRYKKLKKNYRTYKGQTYPTIGEALAVTAPPLVLEVTLGYKLLVMDTARDTDTPAAVSPGAQGRTLRHNGFGDHTLPTNGTATEINKINYR